MIVPFRDARQLKSYPARHLINAASELLSFAQQMERDCEEEDDRVQFLLKSQDIIKRIEIMATDLLSYKAARTFENLGRRR
ncbi:MAG: hypothetical protein DWQ56_11250 [Microcystis aeruginosa DA14]|uniref:Uncharacterized protein n=1 Tax=Microcystis aeruginosa DA14 TaxID=1987506 RepID=A0A3E0MFP3_MICAE|nr:MAG: hypothetical protein DWQ56_11250 [Microcystis aeruginosa DA14]